MLDSIEERRVKNFIGKNDDDPYFTKWQDLPWSQQIIFILKEIVNENLNLKHQIRDLKGVKIEEPEPEEEREETEQLEPIEETTEEPFKEDIPAYDMEDLEIIPEKEIDEIIEPEEKIIELIDIKPKLNVDEKREKIKGIIEEEIEPKEKLEYICSKCNRKFPNKGLLTSHINKHQKENIDV